MILSTFIFAAEEAEKSKTPFYLAGALLVAFAIVISVTGFKKPDFPADAATARGVMALGATLVAATALAILYVSN
jgi:hypothetical protein